MEQIENEMWVPSGWKCGILIPASGKCENGSTVKQTVCICDGMRERERERISVPFVVDDSHL